MQIGPTLGYIYHCDNKLMAILNPAIAGLSGWA